MRELPGEVFKVGRLGPLVGPGPDIFSGEGRPLHLCIAVGFITVRPPVISGRQPPTHDWMLLVVDVQQYGDS